MKTAATLALLFCGFSLAPSQTVQSAPAEAATAPAPTATAETAKNAPEMTTKDSAATFSTRVNLVMVPVVVRDGKGRAIGTLHEEDFQLFDKGKLQVISRFAIEKPGTSTISAVVATNEKGEGQPSPETTPAPGPIPDRFVAYFLDDLHLSTGDLMLVRQAADRLLNEVVDPTTRIALYTGTGLGDLDFTDDRAKLHAAILGLQPHFNNRVQPGGVDISDYQADQILKNDTQALEAAVQEILASGILPNDPSSRAIATQMAQSMSQETVRAAENDSGYVLRKVEDTIRRLSRMPGARTMVMISPGFFLPEIVRMEETQVMDLAIKSNVTINALDARGLYTIIPGGDASTPSTVTTIASSVKANYQMSAALAQADLMAELADGTGGTFFHNDNGLKEGLKLLAARPEYIYILGFNPQNLKYDGSRHGLKITLRSPKGLDVQARRAYYAPNHAINPEEQSKQEIQEALFSRDELQDIPIDLHLQFFKASESAAKISVVAHVDLKQLHFRKVEDRNNDKLTIISGVFDRNGNYVGGIKKEIELRLKDQTLDTLGSSGINVKTTLDVMPGSYVIRLVVRDQEGQTMAARNGVVQIP